MSANGIAHLTTKEERQIAKLDLAASKRQADIANRDNANNADLRYSYDLTELPTYYSGNSLIDNANLGGLVVGRPWVVPSGIVYHLLLAEDGSPLITENGNWIDQI